MLLQLMGLLDLLAAIVLILLSWGIGEVLGWVLAGYLILKGVAFFSFVGLLDVLAGILMIAAIFGSTTVLTWLAVFWLAQKFFFSLV